MHTRAFVAARQTTFCITLLCCIATQVPKWLKDNAESKHAAVYAVVGKEETVSFVGISRNVALSVAAHVANEGKDMVHSLKVRRASLPPSYDGIRRRRCVSLPRKRALWTKSIKDGCPRRVIATGRGVW